MQRLLGAARGAASRLARCRASVPCATVEADGVQPLEAQLPLPGIVRRGGGILEEVAEDAGQGTNFGWGRVGQQGHHQGPERAGAADPLGEVEGESVPSHPAV